ncbi:protein of unknown function DUF982 [Rhizobium sp. CF080]|uniref:DUF982 domain-containing protein n=1 Tax=Rhizobium sp. (strain CF080) TaxID=1144310 RepID=UPI00027188CD|nr:DUF982 domain-containing protein [Rhizobium sp. CF080]EUB97174.1 protein of unknown function DUF982 [Rhizobium sp. CF080]
MSVVVTTSASWRAPVLIRIGFGSSEAVRSPSEALDYLVERWPREVGDHHKIALHKCLVATTGAIPVEVAREAFISAAIEAYVLA